MYGQPSHLRLQQVTGEGRQLHRDICFSVMIPNLLMLSKPPLAPRRFQPCPARYSSPPERPPSCPANRALENQTCGAVGGQQHRPEPQGHSCSSLGKLYKEAKETREEKLRDSSFWTPGKDKKAVSLCELSSDVFVSLGSLRVAFRSDHQEEKACGAKRFSFSHIRVSELFLNVSLSYLIDCSRGYWGLE
ncbi:uncharacterized protein LOC123503877 [Portunus trituberculatus]|uniref:uncharacterized protein LOC123503877 n=1 Tax=Portunus trituberculatus TaxID=210409 RepID=UPI001E1CBE56|nr:uncharacterized protein LOC123503877 [Portunus trituberculatus]